MTKTIAIFCKNNTLLFIEEEDGEEEDEEEAVLLESIEERIGAEANIVSVCVCINVCIGLIYSRIKHVKKQ